MAGLNDVLPTKVLNHGVPLPSGDKVQVFGVFLIDGTPGAGAPPSLSGVVTDTVAVAVLGNLVAAANAARDSLILSVPSTATDSVWFSCDNAPAIGKGMEVLPGGSLVVGKRAAFYWAGIIHAISASAVTLGRTEATNA